MGNDRQAQVTHWCPLQVRLRHVGHVGHEVADAIASIGGRVGVGQRTTALLAVDAVGGHGRGRLAGRGLAVDEAGVVVLVLLAADALLDNAALAVGDGGQAAGAVVHDVEEAQEEDEGHGQHGHYHQRDAHGQTPRRVPQRHLFSLRDKTTVLHTHTSGCLCTVYSMSKLYENSMSLLIIIFIKIIDSLMMKCK